LALIKFRKGFNGITNFINHELAKFDGLEVQIVDYQYAGFSIGFAIHPRYKSVAYQYGQ
jgi:hypothetical protein